MKEASSQAEDKGVMPDPGRGERGTEERREDGEEGSNHKKWEMVVELIQTEFLEGETLEEAG